VAAEQLDAAGRDIALELEQRDLDLTAVMSSPAGRRFVSRLIRAARVDEASYRGELTHAMAFNEGVREMGIKLKADVKRVCFALYVEMERENPPPNLVHQRSDASAS
jgi:hypothetical protein